MRNLVLGSDGFVGRPFCRYLLELGEEVLEIDIKHSPEEDLRIYDLDLEGVDRVYFLAWDVGGAKYLYNSDTQVDQLEWNLALLKNVMPQLRKSGVSFLFVSSQLAEEPDTVYGVTKRIGEVWTRLCGGRLVRLWNVYGPLEDVTSRSHVISDLITQALGKGEIHLLTNGLEERQFVHISDVCKAFHQVMELTHPREYDITNFRWVTILDIAKIIGELTGAKVVQGKVRGRSQNHSFKGIIPGWLPRIETYNGIKDMLNKARSNLLP